MRPFRNATYWLTERRDPHCPAHSMMRGVGRSVTSVRKGRSSTVPSEQD